MHYKYVTYQYTKVLRFWHRTLQKPFGCQGLPAPAGRSLQRSPRSPNWIIKGKGQEIGVEKRRKGRGGKIGENLLHCCRGDKRPFLHEASFIASFIS